MRKVAWWAAAVLLGWAGTARAQVEQYPGTAGTYIPIGETGWTATAARTVGSGNSVIQAEAGWPGLSFTFLHGADERTDWGGRVNLNYKYLNMDRNLTGVDLQVPIRYRLTDNGSGVNVAFQVSPGLTIYSNNGSAQFGIGGPFGVVIGTQVSDSVTVDGGVDIPVLLTVTNPFGVVFGPLVGVGGEYYVDRNLAVTARIRVGPEVTLDHTGSSSQVGVQTLIGVAYNMR
ncbi:MAG TPA: hypothetical protein VG496_16675 [Myxococcales bacterium]|nr:hypothetical protein [Myxococcales bacterium]